MFDGSCVHSRAHRVGDVCESVRCVEGGEGIVMMVADGRQMEPTDLVATYATGMVSE